MAPHQQRVVAEKADLDEKLTKLRDFITESKTFFDLPDEEQDRLERQRDCMMEYSQILGERIAAFPPS